MDELGDNLENEHLNTHAVFFVIGREDVVSFQPAKEDQFYVAAVKKAIARGVKIRAVKMIWKNNCCYYGGEVPVIID